MVRLPVLTYHAIAKERSPLAVTPARFAETMRVLKEGGWHTLTLDDLLQGRADGGWPSRSFLLHFDDGFASVAEHGVPILQRYGFHATIFVVTDWVGRRNDWPGQPATVPRWPLLDWTALRGLVGLGVAIGGHSISHPHLTRLSAQERQREIVGSLQTLEDQLGRRASAFAYPYGDCSPSTESLVGDNCRAGFGTTLDFVGLRSRVTALERIDAYYLRPGRVRSMDRTWFSAYLGIRRAGRTLRHRFLP
jgi:peptidoglycan/xylan/chitin deacetylase (PgdA/CDA1 family)